MFEKTVVWIDDEPALMDAELFDLENHFFVPKPFQWVGDALSWLQANRAEVGSLCGVVIDVQLPSRGDDRFTSYDGVPVGVKFCEQLKTVTDVWQAIQSKIVLYTRLPQMSGAAVIARNFSNENGIRFCPKNASSRVALDLIRDQLIFAPET